MRGLLPCPSALPHLGDVGHVLGGDLPTTGLREVRSAKSAGAACRARGGHVWGARSWACWCGRVDPGHGDAPVLEHVDVVLANHVLPGEGGMCEGSSRPPPRAKRPMRQAVTG